MDNKCSYCGNEAKFRLKNGKYCCVEKWQNCPTQKRKSGDARKGKGSKIMSIEVETSTFCSYGCGNTANYYFPSINKYCCSKRSNGCKKIKEKNRQSNIGQKRTKEFCDKIRIRNVSEDTRRKMSKVNSERFRIKENCTFYGKHHTKRTKEKLSISQIGVRSGKNNQNWNGGNEYGEYPIELRRFIKRRDDYKCKNPFCIDSHSKLIIHHIDYSKSNHNRSNLVTLCLKCHSKVHSKNILEMNKWKELFLEITSKYYQIVICKGGLSTK